MSHFSPESSPPHWNDALEAIYNVHKSEGYRDFTDAALQALQKLISADLYCVHLTDRSTHRVATVMAPANPFTAEEIGYYGTEPSRMPLVAHYERTAETGARRISDVIGRAEWLSSEYYQKCMARLSLEHCICLPVVVDDHTVAGLSMNRKDEDFTLEDCELLDAFAPHFRLAWSRQPNPWPDRVESAVRNVFQQLGLSKREAEVLYWMTEGKQNREIGIILKLSLTTVQEHVANVIAKLHQENRHSATVFALRARLQSAG